MAFAYSLVIIHLRLGEDRVVDIIETGCERLHTPLRRRIWEYLDTKCAIAVIQREVDNMSVLQVVRKNAKLTEIVRLLGKQQEQLGYLYHQIMLVSSQNPALFSRSLAQQYGSAGDGAKGNDSSNTIDYQTADLAFLATLLCAELERLGAEFDTELYPLNGLGATGPEMVSPSLEPPTARSLEDFLRSTVTMTEQIILQAVLKEHPQLWALEFALNPETKTNYRRLLKAKFNATDTAIENVLGGFDVDIAKRMTHPALTFFYMGFDQRSLIEIANETVACFMPIVKEKGLTGNYTTIDLANYSSDKHLPTLLSSKHKSHRMNLVRLIGKNPRCALHLRNWHLCHLQLQKYLCAMWKTGVIEDLEGNVHDCRGCIVIFTHLLEGAESSDVQVLQRRTLDSFRESAWKYAYRKRSCTMTIKPVPDDIID
ncbi:hypothetical protein EV182_002286 [Spiromyces aspiralis]|uniref:Uncharacterized protein n=1 Tax=Spiromyces aspiralis TaxID=68401 RepID=A0ACC1HSW0_9FUNG|nr:hypothetical protein EV182_002286 [Spiromyces aspiralis]